MLDVFTSAQVVFPLMFFFLKNVHTRKAIVLFSLAVDLQDSDFSKQLIA